MTEPNALKTYVVLKDYANNFTTHKVELSYSHHTGWTCKVYKLILDDIYPDDQEWTVEEKLDRAKPFLNDIQQALNTYQKWLAAYQTCTGFSHFDGEYYYDYIKSIRTVLSESELHQRLEAYYGE